MIITPLTISIHAPAKGATACHLNMEQLMSKISIHAPAKGATLTLTYSPECLPISIHAPAKGATWQERMSNTAHQRISIHAPAKGATLVEYLQAKGQTFQSTHPRRVRHFMATTTSDIQKHFNPRTREGCDLEQNKAVQSLLISIHAPAKGATRKHRIKGRAKDISIHAPAKGAT